MNKRLLLFFRIALCCALLGNLTEIQAQNMALEWAKSISNGHNLAQAFFEDMAIDPDGNTYLTGRFWQDTLDFDPGPGLHNLVARGISDIFVLKLDAAGNFVWVKQVGSNAAGSWFRADEGATSIALDSRGNIVIAGVFYDTADLDPGPGVADFIATGANNHTGFILKLDHDGNYLWAKTMDCPNTSSEVNAEKLSIDDEGSIFVTGTFRGLVDFDPGAGIANLSSQNTDIYVLKLDSNGSYRWATPLLSDNGWPYSIARDPRGNVYVAGWSDVYSSGGNWSGAGPAVTVWQVDKAGNRGWVYQTDDETDPLDQPGDIICDTAGNIYVAGYFLSGIDFNPGPGVDSFWANNFPNRDMFVLKLDSAGQYLWAKALRTNNDLNSSTTQSPQLVMDAAHNLLLAGYFTGTTDFDPGPGVVERTAAPSPFFGFDIFLLKMDTAGHYLGVETVGGNGTDNPATVAVDAHGNLWCAGEFDDTVDFDPGPGRYNIYTSGQFIFKWRCNDTSSSRLWDTACAVFELNGEQYTRSGTYTQTRPNRMGCDSLIHLYLTITDLAPQISVNGFELSTDPGFARYQWCRNQTPIAGATESKYRVKENGDYTVIVTNAGGCQDTSASYPITNVAITGLEPEGHSLTLYPNPAGETVYIAPAQPLTLVLCNIEGKEIYRRQETSHIAVNSISPGLYFLKIYDRQGRLLQVEKFVRNNP